MRKSMGAAAMAAACWLAAATPAAAGREIGAGNGHGGAELIRRLDIMLMVTGLRCRTGRDDFQADYGQFTRRHMPVLNAANAELRADYARRYGPGGAARALDRISTTMANRYGQGHPWLGCAQLRQVTRDLALVSGRATLEEAADQLLADSGSARLAWQAR